MREIKLNSGLCRYDTRDPFPLGDLELYISNLPACSGDFRLIALCNNKKIDTYTITRDNPRIRIPRSNLSAGVFSCQVLHFQGDTVVRRYAIENLLITSIDDDLSAEPEITALNNKIAKLAEQAEAIEKSISNVNSAAETVEKEIERLKAKVQAVLKWSYETEIAVPYLDGGTVEEFSAKLGLEFTEEEKIYITGGNQNNE